MSNIETPRALLGMLLKIKDDPNGREGKGLCECVTKAANSIDMPQYLLYSCEVLMQVHIKTWPLYSGSQLFPVPSPEDSTDYSPACAEYRRCLGTYAMWSASDPYGQARLALLDYLIEQLQATIAKHDSEKRGYLTHRLLSIGLSVPHLVEAVDATHMYVPTDIGDGRGYSGAYVAEHNRCNPALTDYVARVHAAGYEQIGSGNFSAVYSHPDTPDVVYKVSACTDDAYAAYALWVRNNPHEHAPTMHEIQRDGGIIVFCMPRYVPTWTVEDPTWRDGDLGMAVYRIRGERESELNLPGTLIEYIKSVMEYFRGAATIDIHKDNVMWDATTQRLILTDPVSFTNKPSAG